MDSLSPTFEPLNFAANLVSIAGIAVNIYVAVQVFKLVRRIEMVLAPKSGIEGYLNMCGQVVEADPDGTCVINGDGEVILVNRAMEDISGYHRSELIGKPVEILVPESLRQIHATAHRPGFMLSSATRPMRGLVLRHKRGHERPADIYLGHYRDSSGEYAIAKVRIPKDMLASQDTYPIIK